VKTNNRLVLISFKEKAAFVYEDKRMIAHYEFVPEDPFTKDDIEYIRTMDYKEKA
jgi:hypothetical protein